MGRYVGINDENVESDQPKNRKRQRIMSTRSRTGMILRDRTISRLGADSSTNLTKSLAAPSIRELTRVTRQSTKREQPPKAKLTWNSIPAPVFGNILSYLDNHDQIQIGKDAT